MINNKLTDKEFEIIKKHTIKGYNYISHRDDLSEASKKIVLQHHETIDGKGYPKGITGDNISFYAKITGICDHYEALCSERTYKKAITPSLAIEYLLEKAGTYFDLELTREFIGLVAPYIIKKQASLLQM
ncbi:HD domain-containing phosphohydrolase [Caldisalinibacter kiritimatiensis]|uniref:HD-GYP domain-containing protein n=1 Tax=Caldisalinibacter kiritimatiensis TaxID=1304284 RepID=UPI0009DB59A9